MHIDLKGYRKDDKIHHAGQQCHNDMLLVDLILKYSLYANAQRIFATCKGDGAVYKNRTLLPGQINHFFRCVPSTGNLNNN